MGGLPDLIFVIDTNKESIAVGEANKLGIPVVAMVDSNSDPRGIRYPVPGNDDASRAIKLYLDLMVAAVLDGIQAEMVASGADIGSREDLEDEELPDRRRSTHRRGAAGAPRQRPRRRSSRPRQRPRRPRHLRPRHLPKRLPRRPERRRLARHDIEYRIDHG